MKILFDTNVILDVLLDREPFSDPAAYLMSKAEQSEIRGFVCATTMTTIYYLVKKVVDSDAANRHTASLMSIFEIAPVNRVVLENALKLNFTDFEDAVLYESALHAGVEYILTRNISDFKSSQIPVFEPIEFIHIIESLKK